MKTYKLLFITLIFTANLFSQDMDLPLFEKEKIKAKEDWLVKVINQKTDVYVNNNGNIILSNGLISRTFSSSPNGATIALENLVNGESFIRSIRPEAEIEINGIKYNIGGLTGQPIHNYLLPEWLENLKADPGSFKLIDYKIAKTKERFGWKKRLEWMPEDIPWPPPGKSLTFKYQAKDILSGPDFLDNIIVYIHYEMYDGIPLICKWFTLKNNSDKEILINTFKSEILAMTEPESSVGVKKHWKYPNITVETDYSFGGGMSSESNLGKSVFWKIDTLYKTQVNYQRVMPCLLEIKPQYGPAQKLKSGESFESIRVFELIHDNWDRERSGLAQRRMYRTIAPWITENPVLMHVRSADNESVKKAIDQCASVGYEMVIMTFGSGFNLENTSKENIIRMKELADYAHKKGIALGGYSLLASRRVGGGNDVLMPEGQKPRFGNSPCLESEWGKEYFDKLYNFYKNTGQDILEHDGSYPGDICISVDHPGHTGLEDSQWNQFRRIKEFYHWCRENAVYLNVPDWYFINGSNKTGMGYRETNWSLPRHQQEIIERQNIYDGTWEKTPSMGWMFVPLVQYHGGGPAATIEPLKDHLPHYEQRLANLFGAGVQACYRGPQLYDSPETMSVVKKWVDFYKKHRKILDSDIIHIRRPDGQDYDAILHVNPNGKEKGLLMVYNPLNKPITREIKLNLYYTGLTEIADVNEMNRFSKKYELDRDFNINLNFKIPAKSQKWFVVQ